MRLASALAVLLLAAGCGPTPEEAARAVLVTLPVAIAVGHLFARLLTWLWRPLGRPPIAARPALVAMAVATAAATIVLVVGGDAVLEWVGAALALYGATYLVLSFVAWRLWLHIHPETPGSWSFIAAQSISVFPGLPLLYGVDGQYADAVITGWIVVGYMGLVAGPILLILIVEALVRRHRLRGRGA
jgi:hypothetical protein